MNDLDILMGDGDAASQPNLQPVAEERSIS